MSKEPYRRQSSSDLFDFIFVNILTLIFIFVVLTTGCGTGMGNPTSPQANAIPLDEGDFTAGSGDGAFFDFTAPISEYEASSVQDCGTFSQNSTLAEIADGRDCVLAGLSACIEVKYLLADSVDAATLFVSFVSVELTVDGCRLRVHTVSNDATRFVGDDEKTCAEPEEGVVLELACGIGE